ncbi:hypothetical protein [Saccharopolyspora sp. NPDC002578]
MIRPLPLDPLEIRFQRAAQDRWRLRLGVWTTEGVLIAALLIAAVFGALGFSVQWLLWPVLAITIPLGIGLRVVLAVADRRHRYLGELISERNGVPVRVRPAHGISIVLPWQLARALFRPYAVDKETRTLERVAFWRSASGLLTVSIATGLYQKSVLENLTEASEKTFWTALLALCVVPVVLPLLFFATHRRFRGRFGAGFSRLGGRLLAGLGTVVIPVAVAVGCIVALWAGSDGEETQVITEGWQYAVGLTAFLFVGWLAGYALCFVYWAARTAMWTSDVHPLLAPVISAALAVTMTGIEFVGRWTTAQDPVPDELSYALNLCGLVTTLALAFVEYRHLRGTGIGWLTGPDPLEQDTVPIPRVEPVTDRLQAVQGTADPIVHGLTPRPRRPVRRHGPGNP